MKQKMEQLSILKKHALATSVNHDILGMAPFDNSANQELLKAKSCQINQN